MDTRGENAKTRAQPTAVELPMDRVVSDVDSRYCSLLDAGVSTLSVHMNPRVFPLKGIQNIKIERNLKDRRKGDDVKNAVDVVTSRATRVRDRLQPCIAGDVAGQGHGRRGCVLTMVNLLIIPHHFLC